MTPSALDVIEPTPPLLELKEVSVKDEWAGTHLSNLNLTLAPGTAVHLNAETASDANLFMRLLATLEWPHKGTVLYRGRRLHYARYEDLLPIKRTIGYLYPSAAMVRNRTVEENLDYQAHYFPDTDLEHHTQHKQSLVRAFGIGHILGKCPEMAGSIEQRRAIAVRELLKEPTLFLAEYPEEFVGRGCLSHFIGEIRHILSRGGVFIFSSNYRGLGRELNPVEVTLPKGETR